MDDPPGRQVMHTCTNAACRLRFPVPANRAVLTCPMCDGQLLVDPPGPRAAPDLPVAAGLAPAPPAGDTAMAGLLDNVRSVVNVGAMVRTADAMGLVHVDLVGITAPGDHPDMAKTALGAQDWVPWTRHRHGPARVRALQAAGWTVWAIEEAPEADVLVDAVGDLAAAPPAGLVIVVGHEVAGVDPALLALADRVVGIRMHGRKRSLNVGTAFGIAAWAIGTALDSATT